MKKGKLRKNVIEKTYIVKLRDAESGKVLGMRLRGESAEGINIRLPKSLEIISIEEAKD